MNKRKIPNKEMSLSGVMKGKNNENVYFESALERDFITLCLYDLTVESISSQPLALNYKDNAGIEHFYYPDFLIKYKDKRKPIVSEIKYRNDLKNEWITLKPKFKAGVKYAHGHNSIFKIYTDVEIRTPFLKNANFLLNFRNMEPMWEKACIVLDVLKELRETDPNALITAIYKNKENRAKLIPVIWYLMSNGHIGADLSQPLTMKSRIWLKEICYND